ncbi:UDP-glucose 4-epimerase GalE [Tellurirhabdus bombi]|uniref:UDP-glucose 4-epimerase GalE n=1 Tax=Tellurirhabdus bombi TaxID=2907205 RepID=UPI001F1E25DF|nr:UDP-glucose 4-epimerase GalE [Tellurirhabdus bombi]
MKILVTGGAGFIGSHTVVELVNAGYEPVIIDNFSNSEHSALEGLQQILGRDVICYENDCNDPDALDTIFQKEQITGIIHFAAYKAVGESVASPMKYYRNNLDSTMLLLEKMEQYGVKNFVFSSSCTVYGQPEKLPVTEETPRLPAQSPYGNTKAICEDIIRDVVRANAPIKAISLRYFNPIGAHPSALIGELPLGVPSNLVPFVTQTAAGLREKITIFGDDYNTPDGTCIRDYIHVVDLAKAHVQALRLLDKQTEGNYYDVFNVGTGQGNTVLELVQTFEEVNDLKLNYSLGPRRPGDVEKIYAEVDKVNNIMGWKAEKTLADSLRDAWRWQQKLTSK